MKKVIAIFPLAVIAYFALLRIASEDMYAALLLEDGFVEYGQAVVYSLASAAAFCVAIQLLRGKRRLHGGVYLGLALGLFLICMEEISWGQRLFHVRYAGFVREHNVQRELNVHNLGLVAPFLGGLYIGVGFYGSFTSMLLPERVKSKHKSTVDLFVPDRLLVFYFLPTFLVHVYFECAARVLVHWYNMSPNHVRYIVDFRHQEPAELLLSLGFLLFILINGYRLAIDQNRL